MSVVPELAAVSMPITWPDAVSSGPPESPATTSALVSIRPDRLSEASESSASVVMCWYVAVTVPVAWERLPVPPALPTAVTVSPVLAALVASFATVRPDALLSCRTAMSSAGAPSRSP